METIQVAEATQGAPLGAVQILQKIVGEVEEKSPGEVDPFCILHHASRSGLDAYGDIEAFGRFTQTDFALELKGKKLWLWSVKVVRA